MRNRQRLHGRVAGTLNWVAHAVGWGAAGDGALAFALAGTLFFAPPLGEARGHVVLYLAAVAAPTAVLTPAVTGLLTRRGHRAREILWTTSSARAVSALALLAGVVGALVYPLALVVLLASRAHVVGRTALVPEVVPPGRGLVWANTWMSAISSAGTACGVVLAFASAAATHLRVALLVAAIFYGVSAMAAAQVPAVPPNRSRVGAGVGPKVRPTAPDGMYLIVVAGALVRAATGFLTFLLAFAFKDRPGVLAGVTAAALVGGAVGSFGASLLGHSLEQAAIPAALLMVLGGTCLAAGGPSPGTAMPAVVALTAGFAWATSRVALDGLLQQSAPRGGRLGALARVTSVLQLSWLGGAACALALPPLRTGLLSLGTLAIVGGAALFGRRRGGSYAARRTA